MTRSNDDDLRPFEQEARTLGAAWMLPAEGPLSDDDAAGAAANAARYFASQGGGLRKAAAALSLSPAYLQALLAGEPVAERDATLRKVNNWIEADFQQRQRQQQAAAGDFVMTRVAERYFAAGRNVRAERVMGVVYAPPGTGKSLCGEAFAAEVPGTLYVLVNAETRHTAGLKRAMLAADRGNERARWTPTLCDLVARLRGSGRLLIVDQAHRLSDRGLEILADLHDAAGIGILLVGTVDLSRRLSDDGDALFGQLSSRIALRVNLAPELADSAGGGGGGGRGPDGGPGRLYSVDDIRAIFRRGKLKLHRGAAEMLARIANGETGHLRRAAMLWRWAERIALRSGAAEITTQHLAAARRLVCDQDSGREDEFGGEPAAAEQTAAALSKGA